MGPAVVAIIVAVVVLLAVAAVLVARRRRATVVSAQPELAPAADAGPPPMTGLESALAQVTDRSGRPIGEAIDAEAAQLDDLRTPDDTGPLLRRALDQVAPPSNSAEADTPDDPPSSPLPGDTGGA